MVFQGGTNDKTLLVRLKKGVRSAFGFYYYEINRLVRLFHLMIGTNSQDRSPFTPLLPKYDISSVENIIFWSDDFFTQTAMC